jgi:DNA-binding MarR family transcriptional regulator
LTLGETSIYRTLKNNIKILDETGLVIIDTDRLKDPKQFTKALRDLQAKGYITYDTSFISVIIKLTDKGRSRIIKEQEF